MPFKSEKQRRYLWANEPEVAREWTDRYGALNGGIMDVGSNGNVRHDFENYASGRGNVSVPTSFQARPHSDPVNLAYVTPQEQGLLQNLKPGTPHHGPMGIPNYDSFDAAGGYSNPDTGYAASSGGGGGGQSPFGGGGGNSPSTSPPQGTGGGNGTWSGGPNNEAGGGGGGAVQSGASGSGNQAGAGGNGTATEIIGSSTSYAGGGGAGGGDGGDPGAGGAGGGGTGGNYSGSPDATQGTDAKGGGGGGGRQAYSSGGTSVSGAGGDGVVIIRMATADYELSTLSGTYSTAASGTETIITWTVSGNIATGA